MADNFYESNTEGFLTRLGNSIVALLVGFILLPLSVIVLYWNEGHAVQAQQALKLGSGEVVELTASQPDPSADGKLVHISAAITPGAGARDPLLGISGDSLIRLQRKVEMFQWQEEQQTYQRRSVNDARITDKNYQYTQGWSSEAIDTKTFRIQDGHQNPPLPLHTETFNDEGAMLGAYHLGGMVLDKLADFRPFTPDGPMTLPGGYRLDGDSYFHGTGEPDAPHIGDLRITFAGVEAQPVSVVAALSGNTLKEFHSPDGYVVAIAKPGTASAAELFKAKKLEQKNMSWIWRAVGFAAMFIGFFLVSDPISTMLGYLPFMEGIADTAAFLIALLLAVPLSLLTISVAWIAHRPILGVALVLISGVLFWVLSLMRSKPKTPSVNRSTHIA